MNDGSNMKILNRQVELLNMMKDVHNYLSESGIKYSLCGGSLLGAVRHDGFIPWDDDMDIFMDRENYNKLVNNSFDMEGYSLKKELWVYRIRRSGHEKKDEATIDVFVLDNVPNSMFLSNAKVLIIKILQGMLKETVEYSNYSTLYRFCVFGTHFLGKLFPKKFLIRLYDFVSCISNDDDTDYKTCYNTLFKYLHLKMDKNICNDVILHRFEDTQFYISNYYDDYLKKQYGDYMKLPNENEQIPSHI